eukprot:10539739-Lingulodinium_polyedra.AAC.1
MADYPRADRVCPVCGVALYQESLFCEFYIDSKTWAKRQTGGLLAAARGARGQDPVQQGEARDIFRCCIYCEERFHVVRYFDEDGT